MEKTIAAISTANGLGGIGVIRISGEKALSVAESVFRSVTGKKITEMKGYTGMCSDARRLALVRMLQEAEHFGANAVCNVRFETSTINSGEARKKSGGVELIAYGTAFRTAGS